MYDRRKHNYSRKSRKGQEMRSKDYRAVLQAAADALGAAMHIVDASGNTILYNEAMARLEKISVEDVIGKPFREVFSNIPAEESTLLQALKNRRETRNKQQTYLNIYGKEITTINTTVPIILEGKVIAAIEVARDITDIKQMSDTILELQDSFRAGAADAEESRKPREAAGPRRYRFADIIGEHPAFREVVEKAEKASGNNATVFIYGETGTGKELFAQSIHYGGLRQKGPFLAQNCAALPESLLEGILFGTEKGGFTGAVDRAGMFEQASGGTLFLDEVSAMPYDLQSKLLRVLQEKCIRRVGGSKDILVDVRIIAAVNEPPEELIAAGALRQDLYYRLNVINITIPPLRERRSDIPILADYFMKRENEESGRQIWMISDGAMEKLKSHDYPGNVRELENIILSAVSLADEGHVLTEKDITIQKGFRKTSRNAAGFDSAEMTLSEYLEETEQTVIRQHLADNEGNVSKTARDLGMLRQNLQHKLKKYGIA